MNFFQDQRKAKKQTTKLIWMYMATVAITASATGVVIMIVLDHGGVYHTRTLLPVFGAAGAVSLVILLVSLIKILILGKGGDYVAKLSGAVEVDMESSDPLVRRYINVVEEMSIASGTPMPGIYVMENEEAINAFAAGYEIDDAVVAVTRGCLKKLSRDELQGVVAHEFSHIFNGDMKLNIKLIGYLFGLSMISELGYMIVRGSSRTRRRSSKNDSGNAVILGVVLCVVGYVGMFFASLIKASISRQREFLADASSVQFTRNPDGIGGALKKIYADSCGSVLAGKRANEISHMFFGDGIKRWMSWFATHPPVEQRLGAVFKRFSMEAFERDEVEGLQKKLYEHDQIEMYQDIKTDSESTDDDFVVNNQLIAGIAALQTGQLNAQINISERAGKINEQNVSFAHELLKSIPQRVHKSIRTSYGSKCLMYALLLDDDKTIRDKQLENLKSKEQTGTVEYVYELFQYVGELGEVYRLPLIEISLPTLKKLTVDQVKIFLSLSKKLILADHKVNINEFIIFNFLKHNLNIKNKFFNKSFSKSNLSEDVRAILSFLAHVGAKSDENKLSSYKSGIELVYDKGLKIIPLKQLNLGKIGSSLAKMRGAKLEFKQDFLNACLSVVQHDDYISVREYELVRLVCELMLVPLPPIVPDEVNS
jgi:Zn-dependent protease with chaperone function